MRRELVSGDRVWSKVSTSRLNESVSVNKNKNKIDYSWSWHDTTNLFITTDLVWCNGVYKYEYFWNGTKIKSDWNFVVLWIPQLLLCETILKPLQIKVICSIFAQFLKMIKTEKVSKIFTWLDPIPNGSSSMIASYFYTEIDVNYILS